MLQVQHVGDEAKWVEARAAVAYPPPPVNVGPRVEHLMVRTPDLLSHIIATMLDMPQVPPHPPPLR